MNWGPVLFAAIILPVAGLVIWLGRRGAAGAIDFSLGGYSRANTEPADWEHAHTIMGTGLVTVGFGYVLAVGAMALAWIGGVSEDLATGLAIGILMIATFYLIPVAVRATRAAAGD